ncbi:MAG: general secretion pathway protein GspB [Ahniella sp.]|nr:general secretion pathway protein GspB [Ahniella sp.]
MIQPGDVAVPTGPDSPDTEVTELAPMAGKDTMPIPDVMPEVPNPAMVTPPAEAPAPVIEPAPAQVTAPTLPVYTDLPYSLRRDLPVLRFSTYRYHDDPGQRFVVYQERRVSEQGVLGQELWLREIHPDYLVLDFRGTLFTVPR